MLMLALCIMIVIIVVTCSINEKKETDNNTHYINGHPAKTKEEHERWSALFGFGTGLERRVCELENACTDKKVLNAEQRYHEWEQAYEKYRNFCIENKFWNRFIWDHAIFIPTADQLRKEKEYKHAVKRWYEASIQDREVHIDLLYQDGVKEKMILDYINACPKKRALLHEMIQDIAARSGDNKTSVKRVYRDMINKGIIGEKNDGSQCLVRIIHHRKNPNQEALPPSVYRPLLYSNVDKRTIYKIEYSVSKPENVNTAKNTCEFVSKSSGERYYTSLEKCTCPVYDPKFPCKHMVALAIHLGYYNQNMAKD